MRPGLAPARRGDHLKDCIGFGIMSLTKDELRKCKHVDRKDTMEKDAEDFLSPSGRSLCAEDVLGHLYRVRRFCCC